MLFYFFKIYHYLAKSCIILSKAPCATELHWNRILGEVKQVIGDFSSYFTKIMAEYVIKVGKRTVDLQIGSVLFAALCSSVPCGLKFSEGIGLLCWIYITDVI